MYLVIHVYFYIVKMTEETLKFCNKCQLSKSLTEFHVKRRPTYIDYSAICKDCTNARLRAETQKKREELVLNKINISYKDIRGAIGELTEEQFKVACEMVYDGCSIYKLSKFIDCRPSTAKKYVDLGLFNK